MIHSIFGSDRIRGPGSIAEVDPNADLKALVAVYFKMSEFSDGSSPIIRVDSGPNGLDLTDSNTTPSGPGKVYTLAANPNSGNLEFLSRASAPALQIGSGGHHYAAWVKLDSLVGDRAILAKEGAAGNVDEYLIFYRADFARFSFYFRYSTGAFEVRANSFGAPSAGVWYFVEGQYRTLPTSHRIRINNGVWDTFNGPLQGSGTAETFYVARRGWTGGPAHLTGQIGWLALFSDALSDAQSDRLWNNGDGLALY